MQHRIRDVIFTQWFVLQFTEVVVDGGVVLKSTMFQPLCNNILNRRVTDEVAGERISGFYLF